MYRVEWDVKLYYTIPRHTIIRSYVVSKIFRVENIENYRI